MTRVWCIICFSLPLLACTSDKSGSSQNNESSSECGNMVIEAGEVCDGSALNGQTCASLGHLGGTLACSDTCRYDHSGCTSSVCGNDIAETGEQCDGPDLGGASCTSLGAASGTLACGPGCTYDLSNCGACQYTDDCVGGTLCTPSGCLELCYTTADCSVGTCQNIGAIGPGLPTVGICQ